MKISVKQRRMNHKRKCHEEAGKPFGDYKAVLGAEGPDSDGFFISKIRRK